MYELDCDTRLPAPEMDIFELGALWRWERMRSQSCHCVGGGGFGVVSEVIVVGSQDASIGVLIYESRRLRIAMER
jgi:hypothetical protein